MSLFFSSFTFAINLWQRRGQDFDTKFVLEGVHRKEVDRRIS